MWKCIVCKKENQDNVLRCQCGFDRSLDYEHFRTFIKLDTQDIQNYHRMKTSAQEAIKPKVEVSNPAANQPKVETSKPVINQPKVETSKPKASQPKVETNKSVVNQPKVTPEKPVENKVAPKVTQTPVLLEKTIFPKTKLDWLVLVIGAVLLYKVIWPYNMESAHFFTSEYFFEPLSNFIYSQNWNMVIFVTTISYMLMYKSLGAIQYKKRRLWIFMYPIFSLIPLCFFGDVVWGFIMYLMGDTEEMRELASIDNLTASWFLFQIIIVILAFFEDPAKVVAKRKARKEKRKARKMSIFPQTKLQVFVCAIGIAMLVIFANREKWHHDYIDIQDIYMWEAMLLFWILLYWLGKRLRYTYKFLKVVSYIYFSCLPLFVISGVIWSSDLLSPYAGEGGALWVLSFLASWILIFILAVKEEQLK